MNFQSKILLSATTLFIFLCTSCKKHDQTLPIASNHIKSAIIYDSTGYGIDTVFYTYSGDKLTRSDLHVAVNRAFYHSTFEYNGDKLTRINNFYSTNSTLYYYQVLQYNNDGTIKSMESLNATSGDNREIWNFSYVNGQINRLTLSNFYNGTENEYLNYAYTYTNGNINSVTGTTSSGNQGTWNFRYDNQNNLFKKQFKLPLFADPVFIFYRDIAIPMLMSTNNVISQPGYTTPSNYYYTLDNQNRVTSFKINDKTKISYNY